MAAADVNVPSLPREVVRRILKLRAGDVSTLCAVACVSRACNADALEPALWGELSRHSLRDWSVVTDETLKLLVRRACGVDADGTRHRMRIMDLRHATEVTLRGVLAALREQGPLLQGELKSLFVANVLCDADSAGSAAVLDELRSYTDQHHGSLNVRSLTPCTCVTAGGSCSS